MKEDPHITLDAEEVAHYRKVAHLIEERMVGYGIGDRDADIDDDANELGCGGELAASKLLLVEWAGYIPGRDAFREMAGDVGGCQIKTVREAHYRLWTHDPIVHEEQPYVLVRAHDRPTYRFPGWIWGGEFPILGTFEPLRPGNRPVWRVENSQLRSMWDLPQLKRARGQ